MLMGLGALPLRQAIAGSTSIASLIQAAMIGGVHLEPQPTPLRAIDLTGHAAHAC